MTTLTQKLNAGEGLVRTASNSPASARDNHLRSAHQMLGSRAIDAPSGAAQMIYDTGADNVAARNLEGAALEMIQAVDGHEEYDFPRWLSMIARAKQSVAAMETMTPEQSQVAAAPFDARIDRLLSRIRQARGSIGGRTSVKGAVDPHSTADTAREFAAISREMNQVDMLDADRNRLRARMKGEVLPSHSELTQAANEEGADITAALDAIDDALTDLDSGCKLYDLGCQWSQHKWKIILGGVGVIVLVVGTYAFMHGFAGGMVKKAVL